MDPLRDQAWWPDFVRALEETPLATLALRHGQVVDDLETALAGATADGAATAAPWWPEARRRIPAGASLRDTARRFGTNPRRLRRALARDGVRAGGENIPDAGLPALSDHLDALGQVPDMVIAQRAGVAVEAVQGERRRRDIAAFQPRRRVKRAPLRLDDAFPRRPKTTRTKAWLADDIPPVVRRTGRSLRGSTGRLPGPDRELGRRAKPEASPARSMAFASLPTLGRLPAKEPPASAAPPKRRVRVKRRSADDPAK